jgi:hypothetical protein
MLGYLVRPPVACRIERCIGPVLCACLVSVGCVGGAFSLDGYACSQDSECIDDYRCQKSLRGDAAGVCVFDSASLSIQGQGTTAPDGAVSAETGKGDLPGVFGKPTEPPFTDHCAATSCQNDSVCTNEAEGFVCDCAISGFGGALCEKPVIYVDVGLEEVLTQDGQAWSTAFVDLQEAIDRASESASRSRPVQVRVKAGTYIPSSGVEDSVTDTSLFTFKLKNNVEIYGGFLGTEQSLAERTAALNEHYGVFQFIDERETILSGNVDRTPLDSQTNLDTDTADNSRHVVSAQGLDKSAVLDGFTITGGHARGLQKDGGGMYNDESSPTLAHIHFRSNQAARRGGGLYNHLSNTVLSDVMFSGDQAKEGGGMYNRSSRTTLKRVTFSENTASVDGGGMVNVDSKPVLVNSIFHDNRALNGMGGAMRNSRSKPVIVNATFSGNRAKWGGAMHNHESSDPKIINSTFSGNRARQTGGAIRNKKNSVPIIANSVFWGNLASSGSHISNHNQASTAIVRKIAVEQGDYDSVVEPESNLIILTHSPFVDTYMFGPDGKPDTEDDVVDGDRRPELKDGSLCIDAGDDADLGVDRLDLDGDGIVDEALPLDLYLNQRVVGKAVDLGAYEAQ